MDQNLLIALLGGACAIVLIVVLTIAANLLVSWRREKANKKQHEGDIARWLTTRDNHTRDIARLASEVQRLTNAPKGDAKDRERIFTRLQALEDDVTKLKDRRPSRSRRDDDDEDEDDRYVSPQRRRAARVYR